jgi:phage-related protein
MNTFPALKTGAVAQYPAQKQVQFSTQVVRFVDGSEQRFADYGTPLHHWVIRLQLLDESEMYAIQQFYRELQGASGSFSFTDPWSGTVYPNCSLEGDTLSEQFDAEMRGQTRLIVRENRG